MLQSFNCFYCTYYLRNGWGFAETYSRLQQQIFKIIWLGVTLKLLLMFIFLCLKANTCQHKFELLKPNIGTKMFFFSLICCAAKNVPYSSWKKYLGKSPHMYILDIVQKKSLKSYLKQHSYYSFKPVWPYCLLSKSVSRYFVPICFHHALCPCPFPWKAFKGAQWVPREWQPAKDSEPGGQTALARN